MQELIAQFGVLYVVNVVTWSIVSGIAWGLARVFRDGVAKRAIEDDAPPTSESRQALVYTLTRSLVALTAVQTVILSLLPPSVPGPLRPLHIVLEVIAGMVVFDFAFYVSHRLMHHRWLWPLHRIHHQYRLVNLWVRNAEHAGQVFMVALFAAPVSLILADTEAKIVYFLISTLWNVIQHSGYEVLPRWRWVSRVFVTSTHHSMHHTEVDCNFAYFFPFWDQVFGTLHPAYRDKFLREQPAGEQAVAAE